MSISKCVSVFHWKEEKEKIVKYKKQEQISPSESIGSALNPVSLTQSNTLGY